MAARTPASSIIVQARIDAGKHLRLVNMYPVLANQSDFKTALLQDT